MNEELKSKLSKIYELVNNGATEGERQAAKLALDRMLNKYNITAFELESVNVKKYVFKYSSLLELWLLSELLAILVDDGTQKSRRNTRGVKEVISQLSYLEWITIETAYEYFRRHMKKEFQRVCVPEIQKCRKAKTKAKRRKELQELFIQEYLVKSKLYKPENLTTVELKSGKECKDRMMLNSVEGGKYNRQLNRGLLLNS